MKSVAVIGLGPSGLTALKELKETSVFDKIQGFDRNSGVGGRFSLQGSLGVYEQQFMNGSRAGMEYSDFPWNKEDFAKVAEEYPDFRGVMPSVQECQAYLQAYAEHFDLMPHCNLKVEIVAIDKDGEGWMVTTQPLGSNTQKKEHFDALIMCSGFHCQPCHPLKDTVLANYTGKVLHSAEVKNVKDYNDKQVLVVGASISGGDMVAALTTYGSPKYLAHSVRKIPYHISWVSPVKHRACNELMFIRLPVLLSRYLPDAMVTQGLRASILENFPPQLTKDTTGSIAQDPPTDIRHTLISVSSSYMEQYNQVNDEGEAKINLKPGLKSVDDKTVTFADGTTADFDVIICATGYQVDIPFFKDQAIKDQVLYTNPFSGRTELKLYKHTLVPGLPNLAFVGMHDNVGCHFPMAEIQARLVAAIWSGKLARPTEAKLQKGVDQHKAFRAVSAWNAYDPMPMVMEDIGDDLGLTPSIWQTLYNPSKLLFAPVLASFFRAQLPKWQKEEQEVNRKARERWEYCLAHPTLETTKAYTQMKSEQ